MFIYVWEYEVMVLQYGATASMQWINEIFGLLDDCTDSIGFFRLFLFAHPHSNQPRIPSDIETID